MTTKAEELSTVIALYARASQLAADVLREFFGAEKFDRLAADPESDVSVTININRRMLGICVKWPKEFGEKRVFPCTFTIP